MNSALCGHCRKRSYWLGERMVEPVAALGPLPHPDMPEDPKMDYLEASVIGSLSPRGAGGLLRLALQKLSKELGEKGENLNADIGNLVKQGLSPVVQQSLDALRVIGNNAVHPGEIDLKDDRETVFALFSSLNVIVEQLIAGPKQARELYGTLPRAARDAISKRDSLP
ncbi:MAG: DUF4145 domain-containing protein [Thermoleophilaceae bacterium]